MILTYSDILGFLPIVVYGRVTDSESHNSVPGAHVYIVEGEEEAVTNAEGEFVIKTWQKLPLRVTVWHRWYNKEVCQYSPAAPSLEIELTPGQMK